MARPPKDPELLMDVDLRIPVTKEQKRMVNDAALWAGLDVAAWARRILLSEARKPKRESPKEEKRIR